MRLIFFLLPLFLLGDNIYITRTGEIEFYSFTPIEDIKAVNNQVSSIFNNINGELVFQVPIQSFRFKNALMQEHFNENYMETEKYPKAVFKGHIADWDDFTLSDSVDSLIVLGELDMHGVTKKVECNGIIKLQNDGIFGESNFDVKLEDFNIRIPKLMIKNIASTISIKVKIFLRKK